MLIAVAKEADAAEPRVALTPDAIKKLASLGAEIVVETGAGVRSGATDKAYEEAGAKIAGSRSEALSGADVLLAVRRPQAGSLEGLKQGAVVLAIMDPYGKAAEIEELGKSGASLFSMELMPRITRAQVMDVLSSQANLAGYRAVIDAAAEFGRAFPQMMTAAGTVPPARAFVMGAGVAGLQAIATARRLGAQVSATDVRPAAKEQVASLGAKFVAVEDDEFKQAETAAGYAKPMSAEYQKKQAELVAAHIAKQDIVVTTALIPGRAAPRLVTLDMVKSMRPGSVIVDLAVERGGNVEGSKADEVVEVEGVKIVGHVNWAGRIASSSSGLYAKNLTSFLETLIDKETKSIKVNWDDELVKATALTRDGALVHPIVKPAEEQK